MKKTTSKTTGTTEEFIKETKCTKIEKLVPSFGNGELNQVVEKLNEVIEKQNKCQ